MRAFLPLLLYNPPAMVGNTIIPSIIFSYHSRRNLYTLKPTSCQMTGSSSQSGTCNGEGTGDDLADIYPDIQSEGGALISSSNRRAAMQTVSDHCPVRTLFQKLWKHQQRTTVYVRSQTRIISLPTRQNKTMGSCRFFFCPIPAKTTRISSLNRFHARRHAYPRPATNIIRHS
jgi:hypothetical protein